MLVDDHSSGSNEEFVPDENEVIDNLLSGSDVSSIESESGGEITTTTNYENIDLLFVSKNGIIWNAEPIERTGRMRNANIISLCPGITRYVKTRVDNMKDAFLLFFPTQIENIILENSNLYCRFLDQKTKL